jgi:hypothetical protein
LHAGGNVKRASIVPLALVLAACSGGEPVFDRDDLPNLVLRAEDAPIGTVLVDAESGYQEVDRIAEDEIERRLLEQAGFVVAYLTFFFDPDLFDPEGRLDPDASLAAAYAILFGSADEASRGLRLIEEDIRNDGMDLSERPISATFGDESFGVYGDVEPGRPPGFVFGWRAGNVVQFLVAAGARDAINENAARVLAERMFRRAAG